MNFWSYQWEKISHAMEPLARRLVPSVPILFFHGVVEKIVDPHVQSLHLQRSHFEKIILFIRANYTPVSLDDLYDATQGQEELPTNAIILTFDDGYRNNLTLVEPILSTFNIPFGIYLSTGHISEGSRFPTYIARVALNYTQQTHFLLDEKGPPLSLVGEEARKRAYQGVVSQLKTAPQERVRLLVNRLRSLLSEEQWLRLDERFDSDQPLSWQEVEQLSKRGVIIGSHCHDHALLHTRQSLEEMTAQIERSKTAIESRLGACHHFAFPNGRSRDCSPQAMALLDRFGFHTATTTTPGVVRKSSNRLALPRIGVGPRLTQLKEDLHRSFWQDFPS
ncbi:MAG: polysaccharide deacetylase family protein [Magnetococcales bacterium]|nr:polysaccharide deacetylase family protein [Magnetococcales bacterium]